MFGGGDMSREGSRAGDEAYANGGSEGNNEQLSPVLAMGLEFGGVRAR